MSNGALWGPADRESPRIPVVVFDEVFTAVALEERLEFSPYEVEGGAKVSCTTQQQPACDPSFSVEMSHPIPW
jgi:hypothetical protein